MSSDLRNPPRSQLKRLHFDAAWRNRDREQMRSQGGRVSGVCMCVCVLVCWCVCVGVACRGISHLLHHTHPICSKSCAPICIHAHKHTHTHALTRMHTHEHASSSTASGASRALAAWEQRNRAERLEQLTSDLVEVGARVPCLCAYLCVRISVCCVCVAVCSCCVCRCVCGGGACVSEFDR